MTQRQLGGYEFDFECNRIESSSDVLRQALTQMLDADPGTKTHYMLVAKMAVQVSTITDAINNIKAIGENAKRNRT